MIPRSINAAHVRAAIDEIDRTGVPIGRGSWRYHLIHRGRRYPPEYVVSVAAEKATGRALPSHVFNGDFETNTFLRGLGFQIEGPAHTEKNAPAVVSGSAQNSDRDKEDARHTERCRRCKAAVESLLRKLYGAVECQKQFSTAPTLEGFGASEHVAALREIYAALCRHRGFTDFARAATLPPCDYFVPQPGFIVEFDESQHFTGPRQIALSLYPKARRYRIRTWAMEGALPSAQ